MYGLMVSDLTQYHWIWDLPQIAHSLDETWLLHKSKHDSFMQRTATHCNTLQHTATHCNTTYDSITRRDMTPSQIQTRLIRTFSYDLLMWQNTWILWAHEISNSLITNANLCVWKLMGVRSSYCDVLSHQTLTNSCINKFLQCLGSVEAAIYIYIHIDIFTNRYMYIHIYVYIYVYRHISVVCAYMYIYMYIDIHGWWSGPSGHEILQTHSRTLTCK